MEEPKTHAKVVLRQVISSVVDLYLIGLFASISKSFTDAIRRQSPQKSAEFQTMSKFYPEKRGNRVACKLENKSRAQTQEGRTRK